MLVDRASNVDVVHRKAGSGNVPDG